MKNISPNLGIWFHTLKQWKKSMQGAMALLNFRMFEDNSLSSIPFAFFVLFTNILSSPMQRQLRVCVCAHARLYHARAVARHSTSGLVWQSNCAVLVTTANNYTNAELAGIHVWFGRWQYKRSTSSLSRTGSQKGACLAGSISILETVESGHDQWVLLIWRKGCYAVWKSNLELV
jgi:hypothetical protein